MNMDRSNFPEAEAVRESQWFHPPDALFNGHVVYSVKFLGHIQVGDSKGTHVVSDAIEQIKKKRMTKQGNPEPPTKVELSISVDGVTIQEPTYKIHVAWVYKAIKHKFPLHRISFCIDDKSDKRLLSFIASDTESKYFCYVFESDKCAEEIAATIGQAFELAPTKHKGSPPEVKVPKKETFPQFDLEGNVKHLQIENSALKARIAELEKNEEPKTVESYDKKKNFGGELSPRFLKRLAIFESNKTESSPSVAMRKQEIENQSNLAAHQSTKFIGVMDAPGCGSMPLLAAPPSAIFRCRDTVPRFPDKLDSLAIDGPGQAFSRSSLQDTRIRTPSPEKDMFGMPVFTPAASYNLTTSSKFNQEQSSSNDIQSNSVDAFGMPVFNPFTASTINPKVDEFNSTFTKGICFETTDFSKLKLDPLRYNYK